MATRTDEHEDEDPGERHDRQLLELLNELRVALPGVQVLFAFLLIVPFQNRFADLTTFQRDLYFAALLLAALSAALLIAPTPYHRALFHLHQKPRIIKFGGRMSMVGLACLALATSCAISLITDLLFSSATVAVVAGVVVATYGWFWFGIGALDRARLR